MIVHRLLALGLVLSTVLVGCSQMNSGAQPAMTDQSSPLPHDSGPPSTPWTDPEMPVERCGLRGTAKVAFLVPPATEVTDWVSGLEGSPELKRTDGSLVVIYDGTVEAPYLTGIAGATRDPYLEGAVCVVTPDGEPNVYSDVSADGLTIPPGVDLGRDWDDRTICEVFAGSPTCRQEVP